MNQILVVAGEASGDQNAAALLSALRNRHPDLKAWGVGGRELAAQGMELVESIESMSVMGIAGVAAKYPMLRKTLSRIADRAKADRPDAAILVDYSGFNLRLAPQLHALGIPIYYYISPQVWAWRAGRIQTIKQYVDLMVVLFAFEEKIYQKAGVPVHWAGHPLIDRHQKPFDRDQILSQAGLDPAKKTVALLPGSRTAEVAGLYPTLLEAAQRISKESSEPVQFLVAKAAHLPQALYPKPEGLPLAILDGQPQECMYAADAVATCSGTATVETAIANKPMVVVYRASWLNWFLVRPWIQVPFISMVNIIAGKKVVPELLQKEVTAEGIAGRLMEFLESPQKATQIKSDLETVRKALGEPGASERAAEAILSSFAKRPVAP